LATAALNAIGYKARNEGHHFITIQSLAFTLGTEISTIRRLDKFRKKRNRSDYEKAGLVTESEVEELISLAEGLRTDIQAWLESFHPNLSPNDTI
jgi:uncharacterized protein (UPF0332 family)